MNMRMQTLKRKMEIMSKILIMRRNQKMKERMIVMATRNQRVRKMLRILILRGSQEVRSGR